MDDLIQLTDKTISPLEKQLNDFNKKAAGAALGWFKRILGTASEPFFRKGMGERYFTGEGYGGGAVLWIGATIAACMLPEVGSLMAIICDGLHLYRLAEMFHHLIFPLVTGGALVFFHFKYGNESIALMAKYRAEGTAYHTMSRGIPRWGNENGAVGIGIMAALLLFNLPAGVLFIASHMMSSKIAGEQQAAIYSRYLDALDQKVEQEYMENAILGKCPTEITYLCKPLDANLNPDLRNNIAAAAVGKPVKIIAKAPNAPA
jgi:hypothetical protein